MLCATGHQPAGLVVESRCRLLAAMARKYIWHFSSSLHSKLNTYFGQHSTEVLVSVLGQPSAPCGTCLVFGCSSATTVGSDLYETPQQQATMRCQRLAAACSLVFFFTMVHSEAFAASSSLDAGPDTPKNSQNGEQQDSIIPQLPAPNNDNEDIPVIRLGETIRLEEMGPIILNSDGTTRRISNWDTMTEKEREVTWKRISKRNEERRQRLLEQQKMRDASQDETEATNEL